MNQSEHYSIERMAQLIVFYSCQIDLFKLESVEDIVIHTGALEIVIRDLKNKAVTIAKEKEINLSPSPLDPAE